MEHLEVIKVSEEKMSSETPKCKQSLLRNRNSERQ